MNLDLIFKALETDMDPALVHAAAIGLRNQVVMSRPPDVLIGSAENPYMRRWWLVPRHKYPFNIYLHHFLRSDEDRALHDHPWANMSYIIEGEYIECVPKFEQHPDGPRIRIHRKEGEIFWRPATGFHRVELFEVEKESTMHRPVGKPAWTLFITGEKVRDWGFACPKGWVPWQDFTGQNEDDGPVRVATVSRGCGEE